MSWTSTAVVRKHEQWTVTAESSAGESAELVYETEAQARYFAAVLQMKPANLPKQAIVRALANLGEKQREV
jgi:hypothetical protein